MHVPGAVGGILDVEVEDDDDAILLVEDVVDLEVVDMEEGEPKVEDLEVVDDGIFVDKVVVMPETLQPNPTSSAETALGGVGVEANHDCQPQVIFEPDD